MTTDVNDLKLGLFGDTPNRAIPTTDLIDLMTGSGAGISDLVFSPGRPPQVERFGVLEPIAVAALPQLGPADTAALAADLIGNNALILRTLAEQGACDLSFSVPQ